MIVLLVIGHIYLFRRHGITPAEPKKKRTPSFGRIRFSKMRSPALR